MGAAGFSAIQTQDVWLLNQVTRGVKPLKAESVNFSNLEEMAGMGQWVPG
jgi:hypothetical protein